MSKLIITKKMEEQLRFAATGILSFMCLGLQQCNSKEEMDEMLELVQKTAMTKTGEYLEEYLAMYN